MTAFTALLIDDEPLAIEAIEGLCARDIRVRTIGVARDSIAARNMVADLHPDMVFLDIGMPGLSGLELAAGFNTLAKPPVIVFVTAYDHLATEAFDLAVADYVLKPVRADRFERAVDRVVESLERRGIPTEASPEDLWLPRRGTVVRVPLTAVVRIEAERDYVKVFTADEVFLLRATMTAIEARLSAGRYLRIHRSTIIAADQVAACRHIANGAWEIIDRDDRRHAIGRSYLDTVRRALGISSGL